MIRHDHSVGAAGANLEQLAYDFLASHAGVEMCQVCFAFRIRCRSMRHAVERLAKKGVAASVKVGTVRLFFIVRDATRPADKRGAWRKS